jgi:hypothetical protein
MSLIDGTGEGRTNPDTGHAHSELVVVETAQRFAEQLACSVVAIGAAGIFGSNAIVDRVVAGCMVGRGEDNSRAALEASGLEHRPGALDVRVEDLVEGRFDRNGGQMDARVTARDRLAHRGGVGDVSQYDSSSIPGWMGSRSSRRIWPARLPRSPSRSMEPTFPPAPVINSFTGQSCGARP